MLYIIFFIQASYSLSFSFRTLNYQMIFDGCQLIAEFVFQNFFSIHYFILYIVKPAPNFPSEFFLIFLSNLDFLSNGSLRPLNQQF